MKLLIDENIPPEVSRKLSQEHETKTVREIEKGITDKEITEIASEEKRCIITQDTDFGEIYYFSRPKELKIAVVKPQKQTVKRLNQILQKQLPKIKEKPLGLYILKENQIREIK